MEWDLAPIILLLTYAVDTTRTTQSKKPTYPKSVSTAVYQSIWKKEGVKEGIEKGIYQRNVEIARRMLQEKTDIKFISSVNVRLENVFPFIASLSL